MGMVTKQDEFLGDVAALIAFARAKGFVISAGEMWRPPEMQKIYMETGRSKTMVGRHQDRLAIDLNVFKKDDNEKLYLCSTAEIKPLGDYWESLHPKNRWGGNWKSFKDGPHFERRL